VLDRNANNPDEEEHMDVTFPESTLDDQEFYRCEIAIHLAAPADPVRWYAIAAMKRFVSAGPTAFLRFAIPAWAMISAEVGHRLFITKEVVQPLLAFLVICRFRFDEVPHGLSDEEVRFRDEVLLPGLKTLEDDISQIENEPLLQALKDHLLDKSDQGLDRFMLLDLPWSKIVKKSHQWSDYGHALKLRGPEYAEKWLTKADLGIGDFQPDQAQRGLFYEQVLVPLLLSVDRASLVDFFAPEAKREPKEAADLRQKILQIVARLYTPAGFPNIEAV
jgi:hypothetical protein